MWLAASVRPPRSLPRQEKNMRLLGRLCPGYFYSPLHFLRAACETLRNTWPRIAFGIRLSFADYSLKLCLNRGEKFCTLSPSHREASPCPYGASPRWHRSLAEEAECLAHFRAESESIRGEIPVLSAYANSASGLAGQVPDRTRHALSPTVFFFDSSKSL